MSCSPFGNTQLTQVRFLLVTQLSKGKTSEYRDFFSFCPLLFIFSLIWFQLDRIRGHDLCPAPSFTSRYEWLPRVCIAYVVSGNAHCHRATPPKNWAALISLGRLWFHLRCYRKILANFWVHLQKGTVQKNSHQEKGPLGMYSIYS